MMMPTIRAFAGLDGGASKTRARVIDLDGSVIGEGAAGPSSLTLSPEKAAQNCWQALDEALFGSGISPGSCRLVCGVAGHRQPAQREAFERGLADAGALEVISDGYAALLGAHAGAPGAIVITGTGSVGLSLDARGTVNQVGGFGPVVGDEGGGNWLGRKAVRAALKEMDDTVLSDGHVSPLSAALIERMGGCHEAILEWLAVADATRFAALVPLIVRQEAAGDPLAGRLLFAATEEACRLIRLTGKQGELPVSLLGGFSGILIPRLPSAVRSVLKPPAGDAMDGALLRARELAPPEVYI